MRQDKEDRYEVEVTSMKMQLTALFNEVDTLRARTASRSGPDAKLILKCQYMEKERDELRNLLVESDEQMATAQREVIAMTIRSCPTRNDEMLMLKAERTALLKQREEELLADMKIQLYKGHADMKRQTAKAVEAAAGATP